MGVSDLTIYNIDDEKLKKSIWDYSLLIRMQNALNLAKIFTIGQLLFHFVQYDHIRNIGVKSMQCIYTLFEQEEILWKEFFNDSIKSLKLSSHLKGVLIRADYVLMSGLFDITAEQLFYLLDEDYIATKKLHQMLKERRLSDKAQRN